jgi:hypothetical protein
MKFNLPNHGNIRVSIKYGYELENKPVETFLEIDLVDKNQLYQSYAKVNPHSPVKPLPADLLSLIRNHGYRLVRKQGDHFSKKQGRKAALTKLFRANPNVFDKETRRLLFEKVCGL